MKAIDRLTELYIAASRRIATAINAALKKRGVSPSQYEALGRLEAAPLTMTQLADAMGHTTAAATGLVDRLVAQGFVERSSIEGDRRRIAVALSESGIVFMDSMKTVIREVVQRAWPVATKGSDVGECELVAFMVVAEAIAARLTA